VQEDWSPEQALEVIELLDDLREVIWARYRLQLQDLLRGQRCGKDESHSENISQTDTQF